MPKRSTSGKFVTTAANKLPARTRLDIARLKASSRLFVEPSVDQEYDELGPEVQRDASGKIVKHELGPIRRAILGALDLQKMTRYELWRKAHARCGTLSASAVYEYLRGTRNIGSEYVEALMEAAKLKVVKRGGSSPGGVAPRKGSQSRSTASGKPPARLADSTQARAVRSSARGVVKAAK